MGKRHNLGICAEYPDKFGFRLNHGEFIHFPQSFLNVFFFCHVSSHDDWYESCGNGFFLDNTGNADIVFPENIANLRQHACLIGDAEP